MLFNHCRDSQAMILASNLCVRTIPTTCTTVKQQKDPPHQLNPVIPTKTKADSLIILQHNPVYTIGTGSSEKYLNFDIKEAPFDVYPTERGGKITYGPGQLVMYPLINLQNHKMDLHWYLRTLEVDRQVGSIKRLLQEFQSSTRCNEAVKPIPAYDELIESPTSPWTDEHALGPGALWVSKEYNLKIQISKPRKSPRFISHPPGIVSGKAGKMESMGWKIVGGADDFEIEAETRKQPKGEKDVRSKWNSMSDAEKEPYITQSRNDSKEYKERRKAPENKEVSTRCSIKRVNLLIKHLKEKGQLNVLGEIAVLGVQNKGKSVIEVCRSKNWKALASKYGLNHKVTYTEVEEDIKSGSYLGDELKARVLLYLVGIFLCPRVALFDFWSDCEAVPAYERTGVARIRAWGKEEVVRVMVKLKLDRGKKQEMWRQRRKGGMVVLGDEGEWDDGEAKQSNFDILMSELADIKKIQFEIMQRQSRVEEKLDQVVEKLERVEDTLERHKGVVEGKIDGVVKEVEVLRGEVVKEVGKRGGEEEMEEMRRKEVDVIYTPESVIAAVLDSECPAPQKKKQKVEKADIPTGIDDIEAAIYINPNDSYRYSVISMGNQFATVYDVATLKPTEWVGGYRFARLDHMLRFSKVTPEDWLPSIPLSQQALEANNKESVENISTFWGVILDNYVKFTDCEKIMITINYHNSHWYLLVLDMVDHVVTIYDSMFTTEAAKQRVKDAKRLYDCGMYVMMWMESIGSTGATGCWRLGSIASIKRSRVASNQMAPKRQRQKRGLSQSSSQPSSSQPPPSVTNDSSEEIRSFEILNFRSDMENKDGRRRVKEVGLDQEREEMDPVGHEEEQPSGDAMMEEAPVAEDVTIKTVMEYMVNFREHIDSLVSGMRSDISSLQREVSMLRNELHVDNQAVAEDEADDEDDDDDDDDDEAGDEDDDDDDEDDDPNKYIVSATPPSRKLLIFDLNGVLAYIPRLPADVVLRRGLFEFMQFCVDNFVVALWSSKMRHNVDRVLDKLPVFSEHFLFVWDQKNAKHTILLPTVKISMMFGTQYNYICPHTFDAASHSNDKALEKGGNIREYWKNC
ncbi:Detected protein of unknown function [Hibiscus syriacus]|uniref:Ubiquitin-like protease family profile domain-containing protein n=1 Tax=Hibiscus syriacus TaxID=106335 RepID=A0A6A2YFE3_HIBSY|nr:Detected protein of unknown function [Hibiscus syriacus]